MIDKTYNILIVDDERLNIDILLNLFEKAEKNYKIIPVLSGEKALKVFEKIRIDIVLLDIIMPDMDGYEVCRILKSQDSTKDIPVLFITASTDDASIKKAYEVGAADYVNKPFKSSQLLSRVKVNLQLRESMKELTFFAQTLENRVKDELLKSKEKDKLLLQESKMADMGHMLSNIAHQWRQPISAIRNIANDLELEILLDELETIDAQTILDATKDINKYIYHLTKTIEDFREFLKPSNEKTLFDITEQVRKAIFILKSLIQKASIEINLTNHSKEKVTATGHPNEFIHVIVNIIKNAIDAIDENKVPNGKINIDIYKDKEGIKINIIDNAGGIPENVIEHIFELYFTTKDSSKGTGIGLNMSKQIIENHMNGKIFVKNIGAGAQFQIIL